MKRFFVALFAVMLLPFQAHALVVSSSVGSYDVWSERADGDPYDGGNTWLTSQAWWGSSSLAAEFAGLVGGGLGFPNISGGYGPFFAYANIGDRAYLGAYSSGGSVVVGYVDEDDAYQYARARRVASAVPEPGSLMLIGAGLVGLGLVRRRRQAA